MRGESTLDMRPLRRAFAEMRKCGILAEEDFLCCMSCGVSEMERMAEQYPADAQPVGYCFFHGQDTDSLLEHGRSMLAFNGFGDTAGEPVGNIIVGCLKRAGVRVKWDGDTRHRIEFWVKRQPVRRNLEEART